MSNLTPWYLTDAALALLADCAKSAPTVLRYTQQFACTRDEWMAYDPEDDRVVALTVIMTDVLNPLLQDEVRYRLAPEAGLGVSVQMAIDAVCGPTCAQLRMDREDIEAVAAEIAAAIDSRRTAA